MAAILAQPPRHRDGLTRRAGTVRYITLRIGGMTGSRWCAIGGEGPRRNHPRLQTPPQQNFGLQAGASRAISLAQDGGDQLREPYRVWSTCAMRRPRIPQSATS